MEVLLVFLIIMWLMSRKGCGCFTALFALAFLGFIFLLISFTL